MDLMYERNNLDKTLNYKTIMKIRKINCLTIPNETISKTSLHITEIQFKLISQHIKSRQNVI